MPHVVERFFNVGEEAAYLIALIHVLLHLLGKKQDVVCRSAEAAEARLLRRKQSASQSVRRQQRRLIGL